LPAGATVLAVTVGDVVFAPRQPGPDRLWVPLPSGGGAREVRLVWIFADGRESLAAPVLDRPRLEGLPPAPVLWTVYVPAGYRLADHEGGVVEASAAGQSLRRAAAFLQMSRELGEDLPGNNVPALRDTATKLKDLQESFYRWCRTAEQQIAQMTWARPDPENGPAGQGLLQWLADLQQQNRGLAQAKQFEDIRAAAAQSARKPPPVGVDPGQPMYWQAPPGAPTLQVELASTEAGALPRTVLASMALLILLGSMWALGHFPRVLDWVQFFWPEELAGLGLLGWEMGIHEGIVACLLLLGAGGRLLHLALWLRRLRTAAEPASAHGSALD
jgi:hypothetical protein